MSKLVETAISLAGGIHGGRVERGQEVRERRTQEWKRKCRAAEFQHEISRNRATTAAADRNERYGYMNYIRRQATSIRAEGQALRQRARDLHVNQTIAFVNDVRHRVDDMRHRCATDMATIRRLLADPEYTARVIEARDAGESIPLPAPEFAGGQAKSASSQGGAGGPLAGVGNALGGVTGALGGVTGVLDGVTGAVGNVAGGATGAATDVAGGALGGITCGALEGVADSLDGVADLLEGIADAHRCSGFF